MRRLAVFVALCGVLVTSWATAAPFDQFSNRLSQYDDNNNAL